MDDGSAVRETYLNVSILSVSEAVRNVPTDHTCVCAILYYFWNMDVVCHTMWNMYLISYIYMIVAHMREIKF